MDLLSFLLCILFTWTLVQTLISILRGNRTTSNPKFPPGPQPLPLIGNLHKLGNKPHKSLSELAKTYGPIMTLKLGQITTVVISSSTIAKQALQKQDLQFSTRCIPDSLHAHHHSQLSVAWIPVSTRWRNLRKILNSQIFSNQKLDLNQNLRSQKVHELIAYVHKSCQAGVAVNIGRAGFRTSLNLLSNTIFSVDLTDPHSDNAQEFRELVSGTDTTSSTLEWAMSEILRSPETLVKAKAELEQTLGKGNIIEESDIERLPYLQAIVKETFRLHPPIPFLLPRKVETDVELCGYTIPKGAQVLVNTWAIGRDPSVWVNPNLFTPERFLGSEIDVRGCDFELIPFGAGRRICPGLPLAIRMVHLMLGSLINSFNWKLENGLEPEDMDMEEKLGITLIKAQPLQAVPIHV